MNLMTRVLQLILLPMLIQMAIIYCILQHNVETFERSSY